MNKLSRTVLWEGGGEIPSPDLISINFMKKILLFSFIISTSNINAQMNHFIPINPFYLIVNNANWSSDEKNVYMNDWEGYTYFSNKQYIDELKFYSKLDLNTLCYQIFLTYNNVFRHRTYFNSAEEIQSFFKQKYNIEFFSNDDNYYWSSVSRSLGEKITKDDFDLIIKPNLKIELIKFYPESEFDIVKFNWDFYMDKNMYPLNSNMLYKLFSSWDVGFQKVFDNPLQLKKCLIAMILEIAHTYVDMELNGYKIPIKEEIELTFEPSFFKIVKKQNEIIIEPTIRDFYQYYEKNYSANIEKFEVDYNNFILLTSFHEIPFIIKN